jgi:hypothetical protein
MIANILLVLLSACLLFSCNYCIKPAVETEPGPALITFTAELGPVAFPHRSHQQQLKKAACNATIWAVKKTIAAATVIKEKLKQKRVTRLPFLM